MNFTVVADDQKYQAGKIESLVKGHYYDENGEMVKNSYIQIENKHYYFDEEGTLLKPERGSNKEVQFELMEVNGNLLLVEFTGNIYVNMGWVLAKDGRFPEDENVYWFYRDQNGKLASGNPVTEMPKIKMINKKMYAFDHKGHMLQNQMIETEEGTYYALNNSNGELAYSRWLLIDGEWHYFDENARLTSASSEDCPYSEIEEVSILYDEESEAEVGKTVKIPISFTIASKSDADRNVRKIDGWEIEDQELEDTVNSDIPDTAEPASPSNSLMALTKRNVKQTETDDDAVYIGKRARAALQEAYNYGIYFTNLDGENMGGTPKGTIFDDNASISFTSNVPCRLNVYFEIDGIRGEPVTITFVRKEDVSEKDTSNSVNDIIGEQPQTVVNELKTLNKENLTKVLQNNENGIVNKIAGVEQDYMTEYNIGMKNEIASVLKNEFDSSKIKTVGAAMNAEADSDVIFQMSASEEEIDTSAIVRDKKIPIDLSLSQRTAGKDGYQGRYGK